MQQGKWIFTPETFQLGQKAYVNLQAAYAFLTVYDYESEIKEI